MPRSSMRRSARATRSISSANERAEEPVVLAPGTYRDQGSVEAESVISNRSSAHLPPRHCRCSPDGLPRGVERDQGSNTPHSVLGVICLEIALGGIAATACLTQLHPPAFTCVVASPRVTPGSYSRLSPITRGQSFDPRPGWSPLCCTWPRSVLTSAPAHLAVSVGQHTSRASRRGKGVGKFL